MAVMIVVLFNVAEVVESGVYESSGNYDKIWVIILRNIVPSERIGCRERNEKNERFRPVVQKRRLASPRGNPE